MGRSHLNSPCENRQKKKKLFFLKQAFLRFKEKFHVGDKKGHSVMNIKQCVTCSRFQQQMKRLKLSLMLSDRCLPSTPSHRHHSESLSYMIRLDLYHVHDGYILRRKNNEGKSN